MTNKENSPIVTIKPSDDTNQTALVVKLEVTESLIFHCHKGLLIMKKSSVKRSNSTFQEAILKPSNGLKNGVGLMCKFIKILVGFPYQ